VSLVLWRGKEDSALSNPCFMTLPSDSTTFGFPILQFTLIFKFFFKLSRLKGKIAGTGPDSCNILTFKVPSYLRFVSEKLTQFHNSSFILWERKNTVRCVFLVKSFFLLKIFRQAHLFHSTFILKRYQKLLTFYAENERISVSVLHYPYQQLI
jgi:hypothetical protein